MALRSLIEHPAFESYRRYPPVRYAPSPAADLHHWVNPPSAEVVFRYSGGPLRSQPKPYVLEVEHWLRLAVAGYPTDAKLVDWELALSNLELVRRRFAREECRAIVAISSGMTEHFKTFLAPELWPKLTHVYIAAARRPARERSRRETFTILTIGNRPEDKGIPEALEVHRILRARHGEKVRMLLACRGLPESYRLPDGVTLYRSGRMGEALKASVYEAADVFLLPVYWDAVNSFVEASAFGVPSVTTRIHHGDEYVRHGVTGCLLETPLFAYSEGYGTRWKSSPEFVADVVARRERGGFDSVVEEATEVLESMISGALDHLAMGRSARDMHAERFSPEARNRALMRLYAEALGESPAQRLGRAGGAG